MTDLEPPTEAEVQAAVRREQARQHRYMSLNAGVEWARSVYSEEDRLLLDGDSPDQRKADLDTVQRKRDWKKRQQRREQQKRRRR